MTYSCSQDHHYLWSCLEEIERVFPFFPCLHRIFATCPNVIPICVTTALGLTGRSTVWYQPPTQSQPQTVGDDVIDPELRALSARPAPTQPACAFGMDVTVGLNTTMVQPAHSQPSTDMTPVTPRPPKPSLYAHEAIEKPHASISKVPTKRMLADTLMDIQW
jgi:hypothetical protein